jgi:pimeloyl-ACP methyl ester carboxylesterase
MKKFIIRFTATLLIVYIAGCAYMFFFQEDFIFHPKKLPSTSKLSFSIPFEEVKLPVNGAILSGALFKTDKSKGLVFFLHGNSGNLIDQDQAANFYTQMGYDFFTFDYRGFGKSTNEISSEEQFFDDIQAAYDFVKKSYKESDINVVGYSVGTASAAMITSRNNPSKLLLIAPYYSLVDMTVRNYKIVPTFLLEYKFETNKYLEQINKPVLLVHGDQDEVLPFECSLELSKLLDKDDRFLPIKGQGHNDFEHNALFQSAVTDFFMN